MNFNSIATEAIQTILPSLILINDGVLKSIGSDLWKLIKKPFKNNVKDEKIIEELEKNPNDLKLQGITEYKLTEFLEENPSFAEELLRSIQNFRERDKNNREISVTNSKNVVNSNNIYGSIIVGDNIHDVTINSDSSKKDISQLISILEDRANLIIHNLKERYKYIKCDRYLKEFRTLHENHVKALSNGNLIHAHEILRQIHDLSTDIESDEFWTRHRIETPHLLYSLSSDAFTKGILICTYLTGEMKDHSNKYFSVEVKREENEILSLYKLISKN